MFDIGFDELLLIAVIAIVVIGPKDMPKALRTAGRWIGQVRRVSGHFRSGIETMIREAEMEEMEKKWREQNEVVMREHPTVAEPAGENPGLPSIPSPLSAAEQPGAAEPELPLGKR